MIQVSNNFKNEIKKLGKQIDFKLAIHTNDKIITENNNFLMTEDNRNLVVEQFNVNEIDEYITSEDIYNVVVVRQGKILSTLMKELDFEVTQDLRIGDTIDASFGLLVGNDYEWVDYGRFMIFSKEHNEDTNTYSYVAYDRMILTMIPVKDRSFIENVEIGTAIDHICVETGLYSHVDWIYDNLYKYIAVDTFKDMEITYRDVLDMICQCLGVNIIVENNTLYLKEINRTPVDTFDEEYLKDTNVKFGEKYGPINSVVLSRSEDNDNIYRRDETSIEENGLCEFKIKDNLIMLGEDREDYIDEIFNQLNGLEYYINDFTSPGITYLEQLDMFNIFIGDKLYPCLLLNDEIKIRQGLEETIYTEEPEETTTDYTTSSKTDKEVSFIVDKQRRQISSKVAKDNIISTINQSAEEVSINANKISLEGYTTINDGFSVDENGNVTMNDVKINGSNIDISSANDNEFNLNLSGKIGAFESELKINPKYINFGSGNIHCIMYFQDSNTFSLQITNSNTDEVLMATPTSLSINNYGTGDYTNIYAGVIQLNKNGQSKVISGDDRSRSIDDNQTKEGDK